MKHTNRTSNANARVCQENGCWTGASPQAARVAAAFLLLLLLAAPARAAVLTKGAAARVLPVGDSITEGKFVNGGYRLALRKMLLDAGYSLVYVGKEDNGDAQNETGFSTGLVNANHEGYGSMRVDEILNGGSEEGHAALPIAQTLAADTPDVVLLMIGTNDVIQGHDLSGLLIRLDALVGGIFAARGSAAVLLATLPPLSDPARDAAASVYNSGMPLIAAKYQALGDRIAVVDMHGALDAGRDLSDGIHPNRAGYWKMAGAWFQALTGAAPPAASLESPPDSPAAPPAISSSPAVDAAQAVACALNFSSATPDSAQNAFCLGFKFTTGAQPIAVARLGYLNDGGTGALARHTVGIYDDATRALVTPAVVVTTKGGDLAGARATFTYVPLRAPVLLRPNATYVIAGTTAGMGFVKAPQDVSCGYGIAASSLHAVYANSSKLTYPTTAYSANDPANIGPNFQAK